MLSLLEVGLSLVAGYLLYSIYWELTVGTARRRLIREYGCQPAKKIYDWDPILGLKNFRDIAQAIAQHRLLEFLMQRFRDNGTTFATKLMGISAVSTIEPENLKVIQSLEFKKWSLGARRIHWFTDFLGPGIFSTDGQPWAHSRDMLRPNFSKTQVADLNTFETHVAHLIDAIPTDTSTVELQDLFFRLTMDSATEFLFGESTNCLARDTSSVSASRFANAFNKAQSQVTEKSRRGPFHMFFSSGDYAANRDYVHEFVDDFVDKAFSRRGQEKARYIFADELVTKTNDKYQVRSELLNILLAGRDTTASLLSNTWWLLARRPDIFEKLQQEIAHLNGEAPDYQQIKDMKYLRAVLNESLRLWPVVPMNSRQALVDTTIPLGGGPDGKSPVFIPKGGVVAWSVYTMHRRKEYYGEDAEEFKPERWLGEKGLRPGWEYLPFNGGPRICLGQQFALTEASYTTIRLLQRFKAIEARDDRPWTEQLTFTCVGDSCQVALIPR